MAEVMVRVRVCDICHRQGVPTTTYMIGHGKHSIEADLCDEHAEPIRGLIAVLLEQAESGPAESKPRVTETVSTPAPRRRRRERTLVTLDEIEKRKAEKSED